MRISPLALLLASSELLPSPGPPGLGGNPQELGMPGDEPIRWVEPAQGIDFALRLEGVLVEAGAEQVRLERQGLPDAVIFVDPETTIFEMQGRPVSFDQLPLGGEARVLFTLEGARRIALRVDAAPPGVALAPPNAAQPIVPMPPGGRLEDGLPPAASPAAPPAEEPPLPIPPDQTPPP